MSIREPIDFVITWVDGADPEWRAEKARYSQTAVCDDREERYRDWDLLRYWFRGVEKFAPWVRKIHFVTWGHLPEWLDTDNPKLHIVRHEDYIPGEYLPTFNSNALEQFFHRIEGLSEQFVYFNDDLFCLRSLREEDFFVDGKPCDMLAFQPVIANVDNPTMSHIYLNNSLLLAKYFDKRENVKKQPGKYFKLGYPPKYFFYNMLELMFSQFTGLYTVHGPFPLCQNSYRQLWELEGEMIAETASHRLRSQDDTSIYLFREWQKLNGDFVPRNVHKDLAYYNVGQNDKKMFKTIIGQKKKFICINDANMPVDFEGTRHKLQDAFGQILPEKSSFEK